MLARTLRSSLALFCALALLSAAAAAQLRPPLQSMADAHYSLIAGALLAVETDPPAIRLRVDTALRGDAAGELRLRIPPSAVALLTPGASVLALYTDAIPAPDDPRRLLRAPEQARLLSFEGVETSLFPDSPQWRALLAREPLEAAAEPGYREQVFAGLADPDPQLADLWSGELAQRVQRLAPYDQRDRRRVEQFVLSAQAPPRARARLLLLAHDRRPLLGQWAPAAAAGVLARLPVLSEPPAPVQALVEAALRVLAAHPQQVQAAPLAAWLGSTPVLAELAAAVLRAQSPAAERAALDSVLARPLLPVATRGFLEQHRQRLQWAAAAAGVDGE